MFNKTNKIMSLFDEASLVITPNGVKEGKLYSIKPTDGSGDLNVVRATTATRVNSDGLIESVATNIPRLDYTNGSCPSILVEPQRTNLALRSEEFDNASWSKISSNISQNSTISPSGALDADLLTSTTNSATSNLIQTISIPSGSATFSVFAKAGNYNIFRIGNVSSSQRAAWFDLSTGSVIGTVNGGTASVENFGNGWFRCIFTANSAESGSLAFIISISSEANSSNAVAGANIYFWGAQLEAGSYATSYIPTVASAVTRNADVISKTGISDLIGQTEGVLFVDFIYTNSTAEVIISINDWDANSKVINISKSTSNKISAQVFSSGNQFLSESGVIGVIGQRYKCALAYKASDFAFYINGNQIGTGSTGSVPASVKMDFGRFNSAQSAYINFNSAMLFKTRLSNETLAQLTTI